MFYKLVNMLFAFGRFHLGSECGAEKYTTKERPTWSRSQLLCKVLITRDS